MTTATEVTRVTSDQINEAGQVLGRAFHDDPFWSWVLPGEAKRARSQDPEREAASSQAERSKLGDAEGASNPRTLDGRNGEPERQEDENRDRG